MLKIIWFRGLQSKLLESNRYWQHLEDNYTGLQTNIAQNFYVVVSVIFQVVSFALYTRPWNVIIN